MQYWNYIKKVFHSSSFMNDIYLDLLIRILYFHNKTHLSNLYLNLLRIYFIYNFGKWIWTTYLIRLDPLGLCKWGHFETVKPVFKILLVLLIESVYERRLRSFWKGSVGLFRSTACKFKSCQSWRFEKKIFPSQTRVAQSWPSFNFDSL